MIFDELLYNLLFIWMGVGMAVWLIHYRVIKGSDKKR